MKSDIEISQEAELKSITEIANCIDIEEKYLEQYGKYKAKIELSLLDETESKNGKIILVTAINPTPAGEGKTTTSIGLADGLKKLGKNVALALREPSLGPVFGIKGGATGGGYAQVAPMEDINLHFTGDFHAIGAANNLLAAMIDNHIYHGNELHINPKKITWKRCVDMNDRQLRKVIDGVGNGTNGVEREDGYDITVASEIMAVFCLASSIEDLKQRLGRIVIGYNGKNQPVTAEDLKAEGAMTALLKDAFKPNLVQTLEGTPAFIHGGPFANIAHGCNSLIATRMATHVADYVVTEAGFGGDLGAEKFLDIKCRIGNIKPSAVVVVATIRALKIHGGLSKEELQKEDLVSLEKGIPNLLRHISNMKNVYGLPTVVTLNKFTSDTENEVNLVIDKCKELGIHVVLSEVWEKGGEGGKALAEEVLKLCEQPSHFHYSYELTKTSSQESEQGNLSENTSDGENKNREAIINHIKAIVQKIYGGKDIELSEKAKEQIDTLANLGYANLPICIAKTQYSLSDNPKELGAPEDFIIHIKEVKVSAGAGFIVVLAGNIMTMPGLPKVPAAEKIDVNKMGRIIGLF